LLVPCLIPSLLHDGPNMPEVAVGRHSIVDALVVQKVVVAGDEDADLLLAITRRVVIPEQDAPGWLMSSRQGSL
jgi:hypothetical protein